MGTSQEQKAQSRAAIVQAASRLFRERGLEAVSVAQVMEAAGMTHGGFPRHFANKQELVNAALASAADEQRGNVTPSGGLDAFARNYLTQRHRDHPESGCVLAALGGEISRAPAESRQVLSDRIRLQIEAFGDDPDVRENAIGRWSTLIGAIILARLVDTEELSDQIMAAARKLVGVSGTSST
ncbi:MAG: TetR/AcrR family transcriptional regulator [Rhizobiaceae bacterium]|nr:TetR/AcrR family transcriptional regulator [Rhizobiaceae bacterium]